MSARKPKTKSNPKLAKPHDKGAKVAFLQTMIHKNLGSLGYIYQDLSWLYLSMAKDAEENSERLFTILIKSHPVGKSNIRMLNWETSGLYEYMQSSYNLALYSYLAVDAYTIERLMFAFRMKQLDKEDWSDTDVIDRINTHLPKLLSCNKPSDEIMASFGELARLRNNIMHPKPSNIYTFQHTWDDVPLAWLLSERRQICLRVAQEIIGHFQPSFEEFRKKYDGPVTLDIERGIEFTYPSKINIED